MNSTDAQRLAICAGCDQHRRDEAHAWCASLDDNHTDQWNCSRSKAARYVARLTRDAPTCDRWLSPVPPGRGIVTCAGGETYTLNAYILCRLLRQYGCALPIEWFYLGEEMKPAWKPFLEKHVPGLTLIDLGGRGPQDKHRGGWQAKTRAILQSRFEQVLFLDADSHPRRDPSDLFDHPLYTENGAVFWRDYYDPQERPDEDARIRQHFGVSIEHFTESGQLLVDKRRCLAGLERADSLNHDPASYRVVYGDKDLFAIGFLLTGVRFTWNPHPNHAHHRMMHPLDFDGRPLLSHLVRGKWDTSMRPKIAREWYPMLAEAQRFGMEIAPLLAGGKLPVPETREERNRRLRQRRRRALAR